MSIEIANLAAGVSNSSPKGVHLPTSSAPPNIQSAQVVPLSSDVQGKASSEAEKTQYSEAVKATPATSSAIKTEFGSKPSVDQDMLQYPITGPDKLAKSVAVKNAQEDEAKNETAPTEPQDATSASAPLLEASVSVGDVERPEPAQADEKHANGLSQAGETVAANEQSASGVVKTASEAAQTQLTA